MSILESNSERFERALAVFCGTHGIDYTLTPDSKGDLILRLNDHKTELVGLVSILDVKYYPFTVQLVKEIKRQWENVKNEQLDTN